MKVEDLPWPLFAGPCHADARRDVLLDVYAELNEGV